MSRTGRGRTRKSRSRNARPSLAVWHDEKRSSFLALQHTADTSGVGAAVDIFRIVILRPSMVLQNYKSRETNLEVHRSPDEAGTNRLYDELVDSLGATLETIAEGERVDSRASGMRSQTRLTMEQIADFVPGFVQPVSEEPDRHRSRRRSRSDHDHDSDSDSPIECLSGSDYDETSDYDEDSGYDDEPEVEGVIRVRTPNSTPAQSFVEEIASEPLQEVGENEEEIVRLLRGYVKILTSLKKLTRSRVVALRERNVPKILRLTSKLKRTEWRLQKEFFRHKLALQKLQADGVDISEIRAARRLQGRLDTFEAKKFESHRLQNEQLFKSIVGAAVRRYHHFENARNRRMEELRRREAAGVEIDDHQQWLQQVQAVAKVSDQRLVTDEDVLTLDVESAIAKETQRDLLRLNAEMSEMLDIIADTKYMVDKQDPMIEYLHGSVRKSQRRVDRSRKEIRRARAQQTSSRPLNATNVALKTGAAVARTAQEGMCALM